MASADPIDNTDARLRRLDEAIGGLRSKAAELVQSSTREQQERAVLEQRIRELEGRAISMAAEINAVTRQSEELQSLRERVGRFHSSLDASSELTETSVRQIRQDLEAHRDTSAESVRRIQASEKALQELRDRYAVFDDALRRINAESGETAHRLAQLENAQGAIGARISANTEGLRRAAGEESALESRVDAVELNTFSLTERLDLSYQSLRRVEENAEQWDDLRNSIDALRSRLEQVISQGDAAKLQTASVQRGIELLDERIGNVEQVGEQLRARDARRERDVASLGDRFESLGVKSAQEQEQFVALQEQVRRRQIEELEQEIRELKQFLRVRADE